MARSRAAAVECRFHTSGRRIDELGDFLERVIKNVRGEKGNVPRSAINGRRKSSNFRRELAHRTGRFPQLGPQAAAGREAGTAGLLDAIGALLIAAVSKKAM